MNEYSIYWIKEEVAQQYFYKSDILYRFLTEMEANHSRRELRAQYKYISHALKLSDIQSYLSKHFPEYNCESTKEGHLQIRRKGKSVVLYSERDSIHFRCKNLQEAAALLFPVLQSLHPFLFVLGNNVPEYGWISPNKKKSGIQNRQVLYSYR